ncbi:hypothetical protein [Herbaspirillum seropedicae]|uniref:hypothetical protein n=1 Tax=Herbaspirillum seropedicae TaxID=964 RepID=UPI000863B80E|nr:hypothetical protein [Herbaspirillum seropedicae]AON53761.1 hypothetical protein Hsc_1458 [Herbaspirillum seropedicae]
MNAMGHFFQAPVSGSINGLVLNVLVPSWRSDLADHDAEVVHAHHGALEGIGGRHHAILLAMNRGDRIATMNAQAGWRKQFLRQWHGDGTVFVEHEMPLCDMVSRAAEPLLGRLAPTGNLVINCQSTRESVFGSSNAGRILAEAACSGLGFTVGQRGLVGALQALETVLVLGRNRRFSGAALLCAGDRWIDIYPRILGDWAMLSDGAAAAVFMMNQGAQANVWMINDRVTRYVLGTNASAVSGEAAPREHALRLRDDLVERLSSLVEQFAAHRTGPLLIVSPSICGRLGADVEAELIARFSFVVPSGARDRSHFGAANALINLHRSYIEKRFVDDEEPGAYLVWDCDPSGLFGALVIASSAFETNI